MQSAAMQAIRRLRKLKGWSQDELAEASGIEQSMVSKIENGFDGTTLRTLKAVAHALEAPLYALLMDNVDDAELRLLNVYRSLPSDRRQGWQDMARAVEAGGQTADQ